MIYFLIASLLLNVLLAWYAVMAIKTSARRRKYISQLESQLRMVDDNLRIGALVWKEGVEPEFGELDAEFINAD